MSTDTPQSIGRYRILKPLGSGAMGDVYLAVDPHIDRQLAIKTVRVLGANPQDLEERKKRLLREARAAGKLLHPHVVALFDADEIGGTLYLAFEYVPGSDLAARSQAQPRPTLRQALRWSREVATALEFAHLHSIVHRDIKPSNILIGTDDRAKVADFGIAKLHGQSVELTRTGSVVGSPQYMSPEQVRGEVLDGRSDVFSLGVVLYELLCRTRPFGGDTLSTLVFEILGKEPPAAADLQPGLDSELADLVHRMLAKDRVERPGSAEAVASSIAAIEARLDPAVLDAPASGAFAEGATHRLPSAPSAVPSPTPVPNPAQALASPASSSGAVAGSGVAAGAAASGALVAPPGAPASGTGGSAAPHALTQTGPPVPPPGPSTPPSPPSSPPPLPVAAPASAEIPSATLPPRGVPRAGTAAPSGAPKSNLPVLLGVVAFVLIALLALGGAWWFLRGGAADPVIETTVAEGTAAGGSPSDEVPGTLEDSTSGDSTRGAGPGPSGEVPGTGSGEVPGTASGQVPGTGSGEVPGTASSAADPAPGTERSGGSEVPGTPPAGTPPAAVQAPPAQAPAAQAPTVQRPTTQVPASQPVPPPVAPPRGEAVAPGAAAGEQVDTPAVESSGEPESRELRRFRADAARATLRFETGRRLTLDVDPADAIVKFRRRGDRSLVQGPASEFDPDEKNSGVLELPSDGMYLLYLVKEGLPDLVVGLDVDASRGATPRLLRLKLGSGGTARLEVGRSVRFDGGPDTAEVFVDGERRGTLGEFRGGGRREVLRLSPGRRVITVQVPGRAVREFPVEVTRERRVTALDVRQGSGS